MLQWAAPVVPAQKLTQRETHALAQCKHREVYSSNTISGTHLWHWKKVIKWGKRLCVRSNGFTSTFRKKAIMVNGRIILCFSSPSTTQSTLEQSPHSPINTYSETGWNHTDDPLTMGWFFCHVYLKYRKPYVSPLWNLWFPLPPHH